MIVGFLIIMVQMYICAPNLHQHWPQMTDRYLFGAVDIGSGTGLLPNRFPAITWANYDQVYWQMYIIIRASHTKLLVSVALFH